MATKRASIAQAKFLARVFADGRTVDIMVEGRGGSDPYVEPTIRACVKHGWLIPHGGLPRFPKNGFVFEPYSLGRAGKLALENFLRDRRLHSTGEGSKP